MYGQIHVCVRELVLEKFGQAAWDSILGICGMEKDEMFMVFHQYPDKDTFNLIGAVCQVSGLALPAVLETFGGYFLQYCLRHGYDKMLRTLGADFKSFIQNLDSLHSLLAMSYKNIEAPSFRCEEKEDGSLYLHYYTIRPGLYPIVLGLVKAVSMDLYHQKATIQVHQITKHEIDEGRMQEHVIFRVTLENMAKTRSAVSVFQPSFPQHFQISSQQFCRAFPYHLVLDEKLRLQQCGTMIQKMIGRTLNMGTNVEEVFTMVHPRMSFTVDNVRTFINTVFMLEVKRSEPSQQSLILKGQMIWLDDIRHLIFISSPRITSLTELMEMNVFLSDIPIYDVTRELVLLNQQRIAEIDIAKKLDETTVELKKTSSALQLEKKKTDSLLYRMLPEKVAVELKNGNSVEAEKFEDATILFSDIVNFTNIAAACSPMDVVNMLNNLYQRFDQKTNQHRVYKVETIGDAYMVVGGVPVKTTKHAQPVADFALDMIQEASHVKSPASGKPIKIRIGVHSGGVVAGVVGLKMPRYCLFGDTVNTASRMESHGVPRRIHTSQSSFKILFSSGYIFRGRGNIDIKGKGTMRTYLLIGKDSKMICDPDDTFVKCPIVDKNHMNTTETCDLFPKTNSMLEARKSKTCLIL